MKRCSRHPLLAIGPPFLIICVAALIGCREVPTETITRCVPAGECADFTGTNVRVEANLQIGQGVYTKRCAGCHGRDGKGNGLVGRGDFTNPGWHRGWSDEDLIGVITAGRGKTMPGVRLPAIEMNSLVAYVRSLDVSRGSSDAPIEAPKGQGPQAY